MRLLSNSLLPRYNTSEEGVSLKQPDISCDTSLPVATTASGPLITPLVYSTTLSDRTGHDVWLKLETANLSGSFKDRGIFKSAELGYAQHGPQTHLIAASGGNAGLAAATAAKRLGVRCTVVVPKKTEDKVVRKLQELGAQVENKTVDVLDDADMLARTMAALDPKGVYIHPFDSWETALGHSSIVEEIRDQLLAAGVPNGKPDVVTCSVGGGGLIRGIIHGINTMISQHPTFGSPKPKLIACQDFGAHSFGASFNRWLLDPDAATTIDGNTVVSLAAITSQATSLGAKTCSAAALSAAVAYSQSDIISKSEPAPHLSTVIVDDAISASACWQFKRDHHIEVEMACGAALSPIYLNKRILNRVLATQTLSNEPATCIAPERQTIVVVVCGGSKVDGDMLRRYESEYGEADADWRVMIDGHDG
ncbi:hypothetical protein QFC24_006085 [Naganishia onofrii]|uniref:Uncharacterized protein n=1 Tax=Naganishia onofrii TaxID=1851511 RepID=A0ACC2X749_9TREE|nr:hypothetical protein QFC24_006085 [Naganishia onofrii]